jgi:3-dehydroquinate synthase II
MQKLFYVRLAKWNKALAQSALEQGADALVLPEGNIENVKKLGLIEIIAPDGTKKPGKDLLDITIQNKADEAEAAAAKVPVIIRNNNWTIIPLENLIAAGATIIQGAADTQQAKLALETMEVGAAGVCLEPKTVQDIIDTASVIRAANNEQIKLVTAKIESIEQVGIADRVCIDTTSILEPGQGALVGDSSAAMFLVHNENVENEYVAARPFRINAGAVHAYVRLPDGKTSYLSEMKAGKRVLACDPTGNTFPVTVGRAKVERRPMLLVKAKSGKKTISLQLQNAETIRLTKPGGGWISVTQLKKGDEVLAYLEEAGRHFGMQVKETITEK